MKKFKTHWLTLSFPKELETEYLTQYREKSIVQVRFALLLGIIFYSGFGLLDAWLFPEIRWNLWAIRFAFLPIITLVLLFSFFSAFKRFMQLCLCIVTLTAGLGIVWMIVIAPSPENYLYYAGLILVLFFTYTFFRIRFIWASITGLLIVLSYEMSAVFFGDTPIPILVSNNFFFLTANVIGMFSCYSIEQYYRRDYSQVHLLDAEQRKVAEANRVLEDRVAHRTLELTLTNEELNQEIQERLKIEEALRLSEQRFRSLGENSPEIIFSLDKMGRFSYVNPAWVKILGHQPSQVLGKRFVQFVQKSEVRTYLLSFKMIRDHQITLRDKVGAMTQKDGSLRQFLQSGAPNKDTQGNVTGIVGVLKDITQEQKLQAQLQRTQQMANLGHWELDIPHGAMECSQEIFQILGIHGEQEALNFVKFLEFVHPDDRRHVESSIRDGAGTRQPASFEYRVVRPNGSDRVVRQLTEPVLDIDGRPVKLIGAMQDITKLRKSEEQMQLLGRVFEKTIEGIIITDEKGVIQRVNAAFSTISGFSAEDAIGKTPRLLNSGRQSPEFYKNMWDDLLNVGHWQGEIWDRRKNGEAYPALLTITVLKDAQQHKNFYIGTFHDITEHKRSEEQIIHQAFHDALTGLPNRLLFNDRLNMAIAQVKRTGQGLALLFLDLDNFKKINDTMGHAAGDVLLQSVAERLIHWIREEDSVARLGGDEFILMVNADDSDYAVSIAQRVLDSLAMPFFINDKEVYVSASIGITLCPRDSTNPEVLLANADLAMYQAKARGKNTYYFFTPSLNEEVTQRVRLEAHLRKALDLEEFLVFYQPKVDTQSQQITGVEALVRWERPGMGLVPPNEFIPLAEETGLIIPLGKWVLKQACLQTKRWHESGYRSLHVAVNLSPRQFQQDDLIDMVKSILVETGLPPQFLELEITENAVMFSVEEAIATLQRLKNLGVQISLDDFGCGYSSLTHLKRFPISGLKIDRSFVKDIPANPDDKAIIKTIITMGHNLNLKVVAEGVENESQLALLKRRQCDLVQGFYFSRAVPPDQLTAILQWPQLPVPRNQQP